jgi:hypothetical protein
MSTWRESGSPAIWAARAESWGSVRFVTLALKPQVTNALLPAVQPWRVWLATMPSRSIRTVSGRAAEIGLPTSSDRALLDALFTSRRPPT